jgi:succinate-semialdehyde dehydrogenase / glutarate-semialdehyde dehydrogenase
MERQRRDPARWLGWEWEDDVSIVSVNPATGERGREYQPMTALDIEMALDRADRAKRVWARRPLAGRLAIVNRAAELLERDRDRHADMITAEMGKLLGAAKAEVQKCADCCRWYADNAERMLHASTIESVGGERSFVLYQPIGVVLAVMPWNFPFWQLIRFAAPALCAGNVALLKHASNVPQCALALQQLFADAGAPEGVFQTLLVGADAVPGILADSRVSAATLTGSEGAGRSIGAAAGKNLKKTVLELGGSDPFIVMPSASFDDAVTTAVSARTINNGQSCIAAKRFIVHRSIAAAFEAQFVDEMNRLRVGDPRDARTQVGPMISRAAVDELHAQVEGSVQAGARLLTGGQRIDAAGFFYAPTVIADAPRGSPAYGEELFGPVASLFTAEDADDAIRIANDTHFGLGASVWTNDEHEIEHFTHEIDAGSVFVNQMVVSDPRFPFGGVKASGYGRELSDIGMKEFTNVKTVRVKITADARHRKVE